MPIKIVYRDLGLKQILKNVEEASGTTVRTGLVGPKAAEMTADGRMTIAEAGLINEYGGRDGKNPPRRSFIKDTFVEKHAGLVRFLISEVGVKITTLTSTVDAALHALGNETSKLITDRILAEDFKQNAAATIKEKGFDHPLIDHGGLLAAVSHQVVRGSGSAVDAGGAAGDYEGFTLEGGGE